MGTPAVNIDTYGTITNHFCSRVDGQPEVCSVYGQTIYSRFKKVRPASSTIPIDLRGWREPSGWTHAGVYSRASLGDMVFYRKPVPQIGQPGVHYYWREGSFWPFQAQSLPPMPSYLTAKAEIAALNKLRSNNVQLGVVAAEGHQTIDLVVKTLKSITDTVNSYRHSNPKGWDIVRRLQSGGLPGTDWRKLPNDWLEVQYGWKPAMSDVSDALYSLEHSLDTKDALIHVHSQARDHQLIDSKQPSPIRNSFFRVYRQRVEHRALVSLWYKVTNPTLARLSALGLVNPLEIVWEKTKYSFVVDWFIPIGSWLQSLSSTVGYSFKGGSLSRISRSTEEMVEEHIGSYGGDFELESNTDYGATAQSFRFERATYFYSPVPGIYFKNPFSAGHVANGLALLSQAFK